MFLDLKSSTSYAEEYGHIKYSQLVQDCFYDLTDIVYKRCAKIYQYVGDEVILTWKVDNGTENNNCIKAFFDFDRALKRRKEYYDNKYGILPEFKAGVHYGNVVVTEIGGAKEEIAYHGDTINTAARIQGKCNELKQELLISERLKNKVRSTGFEFDKLGSIELKGKEQQVLLYGVSQRNSR